MSDSETGPDDVFDVDRIRRLVELMEQHDLREVDLRQSEQRIRLCRGAEMLYTATSAAPAAVPPAAAPASWTPQPAAAPAAPAAPAAEKVDENLVIVRSPMVGTFYARPNPNAEPYVKLGDMVAPETTLCIIEAMKVFNEIPAETRGKIVAVLVDDEEPADHGRPLFKIDPRAS
jgi:acetyl-CoA carboxylase biotin carboxyl carrier protein